MKKQPPYDPTTCKVMMLFSAMSLIADVMPEVKHLPLFNRPDNKKWTDNTIRYCNMMVSRMMVTANKDDSKTEEELISHMHHYQKLTQLITQLQPGDMIDLCKDVETFIQEHYDSKNH